MGVSAPGVAAEVGGAAAGVVLRAGGLRAAAFFGRDFLAGRALRADFRRADLLEAFMRDAFQAAIRSAVMSKSGASAPNSGSQT